MMVFSSDTVAKRCIQAAVFTSAVITSAYWGQWGTIIWAWIGCYPLAMIYAFLFANIMENLFGAVFVDDEDLLEEVSHEEDSPVILHEYEDDSGAIYSEEIVGRYLDANIHEWVLVDDPEDKTKKIKCFYYNCVEFGKDFRLPGNAEFFILLEPGILYVKFHDPEPEQSQPSAEQSA